MARCVGLGNNFHKLDSVGSKHFRLGWASFAKMDQPMSNNGLKKTDVTPAILSRELYRASKIASVTWLVARVFRSRASLFLNRDVFCSVRLCDSCDKIA